MPASGSVSWTRTSVAPHCLHEIVVVKSKRGPQKAGKYKRVGEGEKETDRKSEESSEAWLRRNRPGKLRTDIAAVSEPQPSDSERGGREREGTASGERNRDGRLRGRHAHNDVENFRCNRLRRSITILATT